MNFNFLRIFTLVLISFAGSAFGQDLEYTKTSDSLLILNSGNSDYLTADLKNKTNDTLSIKIVRLLNDLPQNWLSGLCADVCYPAMTDSIEVAIPPLSIQEFRMYFNTYGPVNELKDTAKTTILFMNNNANYYVQNFYSLFSSSFLDVSKIDNESKDILIYPNPFSVNTNIDLKLINDIISIELISYSGQLVRIFNNFDSEGKIEITNKGLESGIYFFKVRTANKIFIKKLILN